MSSERDLVTRLLKQSILTLCRETVSFNSRLEVDGIVCLTLDSQSQHVVNIHELFQKRTNQKTSIPSSSNAQDVIGASNQFQNDVIRTSLSPSVHIDSQSNGIEINAIKQERDENDNDGDYGTMANTEVTIGNVKAEANDSFDTETLGVVKAEQDIDFTLAVDENNPLVTAVNSSLEKLTVSKSKQIMCKKCNSVLANANAFQNHNIVSHGHFTCLVCLATFTSKNNMKRHIRLHTGIKPYVCNKCPESFARNDDFKRHLIRHTFEKPFRCDVCKTGYADRACVKNHMIRDHQTKIYHVCPQCGECYIDGHKFQEHKKSHPEFHDYRCTLCMFTGSNALMYNKHMLTHGPQKKYTCTHCEISFTDPFTYTTHLKKHKGDELVQSFGCCFCEIKLQAYEQFQRHEHSHIQAKQHICAVCQKHFRYPSSLREHMLTHQQRRVTLGDLSTSLSIMQSAASHIDGENISANQAFDKANQEDINETNNTIDERKLIEENNNNDGYEGPITKTGTNDDDSCSESSEYWCTECNHGFGTEEHLQDHIAKKHELENMTDTSNAHVDEHVTMDAVSESLEQINDRCHKMNDFTEDNYAKPLSPFETSTQMDNVANNPHSIYDEQTQQDVFPTSKAKRLKLFDEETVVDASDDYQKISERNISEVAKQSFPLNLTKAEETIVNDAMKQVHAIQSRFGIKPSIYSDSFRHKPDRRSPYDKLNTKTNTHTSTSTTFSNKNPKSIDGSFVERNRKWQSPNTPSREYGMTSTSVGITIPHTVTMDGMKMKFKRENEESMAQVTPNFDKINSSSPTDNGSLMLTGSVTKSHNFPSSIDGYTQASNKRLEPEAYVKNEVYAKTSVLGMDTEFSSSPNCNSSTSLNLQVRNPGFEKVVTPDVLFKTKAPFTCQVCEETFPEFENFDKHGVTVHRRFICSYCGKAFTSRPNRERHVRYHTGEKPYKCDLCPSSFFRGDDLKYHRTTKHADVRPFSCGFCSMAFSIPKELEKHLRLYPDHRM